MERRSFIRGTVVASGAAAAACVAPSLAAPAIARGRMELKCVTSWPKNFPGLGTAPEEFSRRLSAATDGRITVKVFAGGELVPALKCHDAVQEGVADMYHSTDYFYQGKSKAYCWFASVPFGLTAPEMSAWIHYGGGQELWDEVGSQFGIKHLVGGNTGAQMGGWFRDPITSIEDFKGLKVRIAGLGGDIVSALGGVPVTLAGSETLSALQSGTVDAVEWVGPWNDLAFGFYKIVKFYHWPSFHESNAQMSLGISRMLWDRMSAGDRVLFESCAMAVDKDILAAYRFNNMRSLDILIDKHQVKLVEFSDDVYKNIEVAARDVLDKASKADPLTNKVYKNFSQFRDEIAVWARYSDQGYMNKRSLENG